MMETARKFNESHHLGQVLKGKMARKLPSRAEEIDLRFLGMIRLGDTYDGSGNPVNGEDYRAVIYGNQIAYEMSAWYDEGTCIHRRRAGNELYLSMYHASQLYMKVLGIGRALFFRQTLKPGINSFFVGRDDLKVLEDHPQWQEMVNDFGLTLESTGKNSQFKVTVSKFYKDNQAEN